MDSDKSDSRHRTSTRSAVDKPNLVHILVLRSASSGSSSSRVKTLKSGRRPKASGKFASAYLLSWSYVRNLVGISWDVILSDNSKESGSWLLLQGYS
jgi:hypothetical protein